MAPGNYATGKGPWVDGSIGPWGCMGGFPMDLWTHQPMDLCSVRPRRAAKQRPAVDRLPEPRDHLVGELVAGDLHQHEAEIRVEAGRREDRARRDVALA